MVKVRQFDTRSARWVSEWQDITSTHRALFNLMKMRKYNESYEYCGYQAQDWISTKMKGVGFTIGIRR